MGIVGAFYFKELIDSVLPDGLQKTLTTLSIGVILLNVFKVLLNAFRSHLLLYLSQKLDIALLLGYYRHVMELPMNFFGKRKVGEIISRFNDAGKVRDAISGAVLTIMIYTLMSFLLCTSDLRLDLCNEVGIEAYSVKGTLAVQSKAAGPHQWVAIVINKETYYLDPTKDVITQKPSPLYNAEQFYGKMCIRDRRRIWTLVTPEQKSLEWYVCLSILGKSKKQNREIFLEHLPARPECLENSSVPSICLTNIHLDVYKRQGIRCVSQNEHRILII